MRVVVTGASSGIGRALAIELGRCSAKLVITARRPDRLVALEDECRGFGAEVARVVGDITDPATRSSLLTVAAERFGGLDAIVNNAGLGALGPFMEADQERLRRIMEVNLFAPLELIRCAVPMLRAGVRPIIVNVGSVLGHRAVANKSEYCASKFAMHGFSDALRCELAAEGIDVLLVSPSTTSSEFFDKVIRKEGPQSHQRIRGLAPEAVARRIVRAMERGRHEIILTAGGKLLVWLDRCCPSLMNRVLARFA